MTKFLFIKPIMIFLLICCTALFGCDDKAIIEFSFLVEFNPSLREDIFASITSTDIDIKIPYGKNLTSLVATFITTGLSVKVGGIEQISGITPNDFTNPVNYKVTAEDGSILDYIITVTYGIKTISIEEGTFIMGEDIYDPSIPTVTVNSFNLGKYEVCWSEWTTVHSWGLSNGYTDIATGSISSNRDITSFTGDLPVTTISWYDAVKWCNALSEMEGLIPCYYTNIEKTSIYKTGEIDITVDNVDWTSNGYRLPTEAEWEYAARKTSTGYSPGDQFSGYIDETTVIDDFVWHLDNSDEMIHPIGTTEANSLGIHDMSGNVFEWCWDWYDDPYGEGPFTNPKGSQSGDWRVYRGGSWFYSSNYSKTAYRSMGSPLSTYYALGLRICMSNE